MDFFDLLSELRLPIPRDLIDTVLAHPSWSEDSYDRLEILGDAVLKLVVVNRLFEEHPTASPGFLSSKIARLINNQVLASFGKMMDLENRMLVAENYEKGTKDVADIVEAFFGAIFRQYGLEGCTKFLYGIWPELNYVADQIFAHGDNPIGELQEILQKSGHPLPKYEVTAKEGDDHRPTFTVSLSIDFGAERLNVESKGNSKKDGKVKAAIQMLALLHDESHDE